ncbi:MAG: hypothetical protein R6U94_10035 [Nitriliruptoraceae bacterium]
MPHSLSPTHRRRAAARALVTGVALLLLSSACAEDPDSATDDGADAEATAELEELDDTDDLAGSDDTDDTGDTGDTGEDPTADLEDPNDYIVDGVFAANGVVLPAPEGWNFDELAFASGVALALAPEGEEQIAAEAVDPTTLPEEITFEEVVAANRDNVEQEPVVDEPVELPGASQAVQLRYLDLPTSENAPEGQPATTSVVLLVAEREDGILGVFNYAAASEDFDDGIAELLLETAAFDPDSDPATPQPQPVG